MKKNTRNLMLGLGLAAGALITLGALTGRTSQKVKTLLSDRINHHNKKEKTPDDEFYG